MIDPNDPNLPMEWRKQPRYRLEMATLTRTKPNDWDWRGAGWHWELKKVFPDWYIGHDFCESQFDPFDDPSLPDEYEEIIAKLSEIQTSYLKRITQEAIEFFSTPNVRKAVGSEKIFVVRKSFVLTPEQRESLVSQINTPINQSDSHEIRQAFVELEGDFAVAVIVIRELVYLTYASESDSLLNPLLTLVGREVVVCENSDYEEPISSGILEINNKRVKVGGWSRDFTDVVVEGTPFLEVEFEDMEDEVIYEILERVHFQETWGEQFQA